MRGAHNVRGFLDVESLGVQALTLDYLREEAAQGRRQDFERFLNAVPDVPDEADRG